jgi:gamma-glutamyl:cysteine ligase YbdK (ATP-grasp superfamily)
MEFPSPPAAGAPPPAVPPHRLHLFEATGVEIEYMLVRADNLDVAPLAPEFLAAASGGSRGVSDAVWGGATWSNELAAHVVELKTTGPATDLGEALPVLQGAVGRAAGLLGPLGALLLPTGAHPWMDPVRESRLWDGEYREVYALYDRVFGCASHGWANLQSTHLNFPFAGDDEFARLHAAARLVLPLIPALAASTPFLEGRRQPQLDARLEKYRHNQRRFPAITGAVIPEPVYSEAEYQDTIYAPIRAAVAAHDPDGLLEVEFLNSRGAIARFDRGAVELRVIDTQECPLADLAVAALVRGVLIALVSERWSGLADQMAAPTAELVGVFDTTVRDAAGAAIGEAGFLRHFGATAPARAGEVWRDVLEAVGSELPAPLAPAAERVVTRGPLGARILAACVPEGSLVTTYQRLASCLQQGVLFETC